MNGMKCPITTKLYKSNRGVGSLRLMKCRIKWKSSSLFSHATGFVRELVVATIDCYVTTYSVYLYHEVSGR
jgi:hypothetical protein